MKPLRELITFQSVNEKRAGPLYLMTPRQRKKAYKAARRLEKQQKTIT